MVRETHPTTELSRLKWVAASRPSTLDKTMRGHKIMTTAKGSVKQKRLFGNSRGSYPLDL